MIDSLFFDTDCISSFLWVGQENLLVILYPGKINVPQQVYSELSKVPHLKSKLDVLISNGQASLICIEIGSTAYEIYQSLTLFPLDGIKIIGKGEAASIALAIEYKGIVASNNLKDISQYMNIYNFRLFTTGDILVAAHNRGIITELHGNAIWSAMLSKRRKLGASSFSEFLNNL